MRLLDIATVIVENGHHPDAGDPRECAVTSTVELICDDGADSTLVDGDTDSEVYRLYPFAIDANLERSATCERDDDATFLASAMEDLTERAITLALVSKSNEDATVWNGNASAYTSPTVVSARNLWFDNHVVSDYRSVPILHVSPEALLVLSSAGIVKVPRDSDEIRTIWGDPVVVSVSYSGQQAFWTGPVTVHLSSVESDDWSREARRNRVAFHATRIATVDTAPCSFVVATDLATVVDPGAGTGANVLIVDDFADVPPGTPEGTIVLSRSGV